MKFRTERRSAMLSRVKRSPRGLTASAPFSSTRAARGMSWVTTRSPGGGAFSDEVVGGVESALYLQCADVARGWSGEPLVGDQGHLHAGAFGGAEQDFLDGAGAGVGINPDAGRCVG
mgnify:CR=1 FL=1